MESYIKVLIVVLWEGMIGVFSVSVVLINQVVKNPLINILRRI